VLELLRLLRDTRDRLTAVSQPVLVVQSRDDNIVPRNNAIAIYEGVGSAVKSLLWLENCYHVATLDYDAPLLNAEVIRFVEAQISSPVRPADEPPP
jgi:carboxylesterase